MRKTHIEGPPILTVLGVNGKSVTIIISFLTISRLESRIKRESGETPESLIRIGSTGMWHQHNVKIGDEGGWHGQCGEVW